MLLCTDEGCNSIISQDNELKDINILTEVLLLLLLCFKRGEKKNTGFINLVMVVQGTIIESQSSEALIESNQLQTEYNIKK